MSRVCAADALVVDEEEQLVLDDRATEVAAELVHAAAALCWAAYCEVIFRVQRIVAEELEQLAVELDSFPTW